MPCATACLPGKRSSCSAASFHPLPRGLRPRRQPPVGVGVIKTPRSFWRTASRVPLWDATVSPRGTLPCLLFCFELLRPRDGPHPFSLSLRERD